MNYNIVIWWYICCVLLWYYRISRQYLSLVIYFHLLYDGAAMAVLTMRLFFNNTTLFVEMNANLQSRPAYNAHHVNTQHSCRTGALARFYSNPNIAYLVCDKTPHSVPRSRECIDEVNVNAFRARCTDEYCLFYWRSIQQPLTPSPRVCGRGAKYSNQSTLRNRCQTGRHTTGDTINL